MTLNRITKAAALVALLSASSFASAAAPAASDSQTIAVSGTVAAVCRFYNPGRTLPFGDLDPSWAAPATGNVTVTATVSYKCTKKAAAPTLTVGGDTSGTVDLNMVAAGVNLPYRVTWTPPVAGDSAGFSGAATDVVLTATVAGTAYQDIPAGTYQDDLVVTITP